MGKPEPQFSSSVKYLRLIFANAEHYIIEVSSRCVLFAVFIVYCVYCSRFLLIYHLLEIVKCGGIPIFSVGTKTASKWLAS